MPAPRFLKLDPTQAEALQKEYRTTHDAHSRSRCQMILLSHQGRSASEIGQLTFFDQDTVLYWFERYEKEGKVSLWSGPSSPGRKKCFFADFKIGHRSS